MRVHLQVDGSPQKARESSREIADLGADGQFSFEGQHDVFFPRARSPRHLARAAYHLQLFSEGRFRVGLGSQIRAHIEKRYGSQWGKPANRMADAVAAVKAIFLAWEGQACLDFRGEFFTHTLMPPNFNPGPNPYGRPRRY